MCNQNGSVWISKFIVAYFIILFSLFSAVKSFASGNVKIEAYLLDYESVCKINSPQHPPSSIIWSKGNWSLQGCSSFEKVFNHPPALKIIIQNNSDEEYHFSIYKDFENFARKDTNLFYRPVAIQTLSGGFLGYISKIPNTLKMIVNASNKAEIIVFFDKIDRGSKIQFDGFNPIDIK